MNKSLFLAIIFLGISNSIYGITCKNYGLSIYPTAQEISTDCNFFMEGYGFSQEIVEGLGTKFPIYLTSSIDTINLEIIKLNIGLFRYTTAVLAPTNQLTAEETYSLVIENLDSNNYHKLRDWIQKHNRIKNFSWKATKLVNNTPKFLTQPKLIDREIKRVSTGHSVYANFLTQTQTVGELIIEVEIIDSKSLDTTTFMEHFYNTPDTVSIGKGPCSGNFIFERKGKYLVRFRITNLNDLFKSPWSSYIKFKSPINRSFIFYNNIKLFLFE